MDRLVVHPAHRHLIFTQLMLARMDEESRSRGRPITKQVNIMDLSGLSYWPDPNGMRAFRIFLQISASFYPESLDTLYFINVPAAFLRLWSIIRAWMPPATVAKVCVPQSARPARPTRTRARALRVCDTQSASPLRVRRAHTGTSARLGRRVYEGASQGN